MPEPIRFTMAATAGAVGVGPGGGRPVRVSAVLPDMLPAGWVRIPVTVTVSIPEALLRQVERGGA